MPVYASRDVCLLTLEDASGQQTVSTKTETMSSDHDENTEKLVNFTHMVTHNLRDHVTNFSLLLDFLDKETDQIEHDKIMKLLKQGSKSLSNTIKGLREIVAIRDNFKIGKKRVNLNDYIYTAEQKLSGLIKREKTIIFNEIEDDVQLNVQPVYLESILVNCLSNAIKFRSTRRKPVVVFSVAEDDDFTILSIEDNGIGMDLTKGDRKLFEIGRTLQENPDARGMGLYLTKYQLDLMGGKIEVESALDEGTMVKIYFRKSKDLSIA